ncbi:PD-(D/E)XK nuclease family protein [Acinetobacter sp.]|uniref:PDDEXK-like family protein n=1 Tax=Acinetobacter sp. TaxID=472 RepID=UPI003CFFA7A0
MCNNDERLLKELILDDDFMNLQSFVKEEVNLMDILNISHRELQHSNFLAWLFNPQETHGLGDYVLKEFIKIYFKENEYQNLGGDSGLSVFDFIELNLDDLIIKREHKNIDLLFLSKNNKFCMIIENKIYSSEGEGQLKKYREYVESEYNNYKHKIYIYLSLLDQVISEQEQEYYVQLNYLHIIKLLHLILNNKSLNVSDRIHFVIEQYLITLESMLNQNEEIEEIAQRLYKKYKTAFDLVFKYKTRSIKLVVGEILQDLIENESKTISFQSSKTYIRFKPSYFFENSQLLKEKKLLIDDNLQENWVYLFEFNIRDNVVNFDLKIGDGDKELRNRLYHIYSKYEFFNKIKIKSFASKWHLSFQKNILSKEELNDFKEHGNYDELKRIIESRFSDLINKDLVAYINILNQETMEQNKTLN